MHNTGDSLGRARGTTTRRKLLAGAAWSAPIIALAVATPSQAASDCKLYPGTATFAESGANFGADGERAYGAIGLTGTPPLNPVTYPAVRVAVSQDLDQYSAATGNMTTTADALVLQPQRTGAAGSGGQLIVMTFDREVHDLAFTIGGITTVAGTGGYADAVEAIPTAGGMRAAALGANLQGTGTASDPWRATAASAEPTTPAGPNAVAVTYTSPVTTVALRFFSTATAADETGAQRFTISNLSFRAGCGTGTS